MPVSMFTIATLVSAALVAPPRATTLPQQQGPVPFRCDGLKMDGKAHSVRCAGNVVVRYGTMLLCCNHFTAHADDSWHWQTMRCAGDVRGYLDGRWVWGNQADYVTATGMLRVTGKPLLKQGTTWFAGSALAVDVPRERISLAHPTGVLDRTPRVGNPPPRYATLPDRCPLPDRHPAALPTIDSATDAPMAPEAAADGP